MSRRRWADPFTVHLQSAVWLRWLAVAAILVGWAASSAVLWRFAPALRAGQWTFALFSLVATLYGGFRLVRERPTALAVGVDGRLSVDGAVVDLDLGSWESGSFAGLVFRDQTGRRQARLIAPGSASALELRRLRTYLHWALADLASAAMRDNPDSASAERS